MRSKACPDSLPHRQKPLHLPAETRLCSHRGFVWGIHNSLGKSLLLLAAFTDSLHGCSSR